MSRTYLPEERCTRWMRDESRWCRNRRFSEHLCKRHVIEDLRAYEAENPRLLWYLANRHLLETA